MSKHSDKMQAMMGIEVFIALFALAAGYAGHLWLESQNAVDQTTSTLEIEDVDEENDEADLADIEQFPEIEWESLIDEDSEHPPIITLTEAEGYSFETRSSEPSSGFARALRSSVIPQIARAREVYGINTIIVVGHTDSVPAGGSESTLDDELLDYLNTGNADELEFVDNVGLGMARAVEVRGILAGSAHLRGMTIMPVSAGQTTMPNGDTARSERHRTSNADRRRIEIWLVKS